MVSIFFIVCAALFFVLCCVTFVFWIYYYDLRQKEAEKINKNQKEEEKDASKYCSKNISSVAHKYIKNKNNQQRLQNKFENKEAKVDGHIDKIIEEAAKEDESVSSAISLGSKIFSMVSIVNPMFLHATASNLQAIKQSVEDVDGIKVMSSVVNDFLKPMLQLCNKPKNKTLLEAEAQNKKNPGSLSLAQRRILKTARMPLINNACDICFKYLCNGSGNKGNIALFNDVLKIYTIIKRQILEKSDDQSGDLNLKIGEKLKIIIPKSLVEIGRGKSSGLSYLSGGISLIKNKAGGNILQLARLDSKLKSTHANIKKLLSSSMKLYHKGNTKDIIAKFLLNYIKKIKGPYFIEASAIKALNDKINYAGSDDNKSIMQSSIILGPLFMLVLTINGLNTIATSDKNHIVLLCVQEFRILCDWLQSAIDTGKICVDQNCTALLLNGVELSAEFVRSMQACVDCLCKQDDKDYNASLEYFSDVLVANMVKYVQKYPGADELSKQDVATILSGISVESFVRANRMATKSACV